MGGRQGQLFTVTWRERKTEKQDDKFDKAGLPRPGKSKKKKKTKAVIIVNMDWLSSKTIS